MKLIAKTLQYVYNFTYTDEQYHAYITHQEIIHPIINTIIDIEVKDINMKTINEERITKYVEESYDTYRHQAKSPIYAEQVDLPTMYQAQEACDIIYSKLKEFYRENKTIHFEGHNENENYFTINERSSDGDIECNIYINKANCIEDNDPLDGGVVEIYSDNVIPTSEMIWAQAIFIAENCGYNISDIQSPIDEINLECNLNK